MAIFNSYVNLPEGNGDESECLVMSMNIYEYK